MKSPTFVKQGILGLFWWEESNNRALFAKLLRHCKLCTSFNILECLISENFLLRSRVSHAYVTQRVSSHSDECTSGFIELCTFENRALMHALHVWWTWMALQLVPMDAIITVLIAYFCIALCLTTLKGFILLYFWLLFCFAFYAADANFTLMHNYLTWLLCSSLVRVLYFVLFDLKLLIEDGNLQVYMYCVDAQN